MTVDCQLFRSCQVRFSPLIDKKRIESPRTLFIFCRLASVSHLDIDRSRLDRWQMRRSLIEAPSKGIISLDCKSINIRRWNTNVLNDVSWSFTEVTSKVNRKRTSLSRHFFNIDYFIWDVRLSSDNKSARVIIRHKQTHTFLGQRRSEINAFDA